MQTSDENRLAVTSNRGGSCFLPKDSDTSISSREASRARQRTAVIPLSLKSSAVSHKSSQTRVIVGSESGFHRWD